MSTPEQFDLIVVGQGYAGLKAAGLAAEAGLRTLNLEGVCLGGLIVNINELDPPAPTGSEAGFELASDLAMENTDRGVQSVSQTVDSIVRNEDLWIVQTGKGSYAANHLIVASGARLSQLGVPGEAEFAGRGVSQCADCDGPMFQDGETVVVGGGDSALQEALELAAYARKVTVVLRGGEPTARPYYRDRARSHPKLVLLAESEVIEIKGTPENGVQGIRLRTGNSEEHVLPCAGVFIFIGLTPNSDFLPNGIARDRAGAVITGQNCAATMPDLYAIGAVRRGFGGLLSDADEDARLAIEGVMQSRDGRSLTDAR